MTKLVSPIAAKDIRDDLDGKDLSLNNMTRNSRYYLAGSVSLITFLVYLSSLRNEFVWDDIFYITKNPHIQSFNFDLIRWAFLSFYLANWHPLAWISHALDCALWGLNPPGHHLTNVILHAVNSFIITLLTMKLVKGTQQPRIREDLQPPLNEQALLIAGGVTGILFGLHPLHVESAAWIAERKDLLCALFFLLSIKAYLKYIRVHTITQQNSFVPSLNKHYLLSLTFFMLALLSKPMAVSLPAVLLILDRYPFKRMQSLRTFGIAFVEKSPFFALSFLVSVLTVLAQKAGGAMVPTESVSLPTRVLVAAESLVVYLWRIIAPLNLIPYYPYKTNVSLSSVEYVGAIVLVLGITVACTISAKKQPLWLSVWSYYVITLIPTLGIVQVGTQSSADRYTYLPSFGPFLIAGLVAAWGWQKANAVKGKAFVPKHVGVVVFLLVVVSLTYLTSKQIGIWKNNIILWSYVIRKEPKRIPFAYYNRGAAFGKMGRFTQAIEDFDKTIALNPSYFLAYYDRGAAFAKMGQLTKAIEDFNKGIALNPSYYEAYYNRGIALYMIGQLNEAIEDFNKAIVLNPSHFQIYYNRGTVLGKIGEINKAIQDFDKTIALNPSSYEAYYSRGTLYGRMGRFNKAIEDFDKTIALNPSSYEAYYNRGIALYETGQLQKSIEDFDRTLALNPSYDQARYNRAIVLDKIGAIDNRQEHSR